MKFSGTDSKVMAKRLYPKLNRKMVLCGVAMCVLVPLVIVTAPFVDGIGPIERVILQLVLCVGLLTMGFIFGTMAVEHRISG